MPLLLGAYLKKKREQKKMTYLAVKEGIDIILFISHRDFFKSIDNKLDIRNLDLQITKFNEFMQKAGSLISVEKIKKVRGQK